MSYGNTDEIVGIASGLRDEGKTNAEISAALAKRGFYGRRGEPYSLNGITGLLSRAKASKPKREKAVAPISYERIPPLATAAETRSGLAMIILACPDQIKDIAREMMNG